MSKKYPVPSQILGDQALTTTGLYRDDTEESLMALAGIGITAGVIEDTERLGRAVLDSETRQEILKAENSFQRNASISATRAVIVWRDNEVMPRVRLALGGDPRIKFFRPGKLRSKRTASVLREARLLVVAMERFVDDLEMQRRGITEELARKGGDLIRRAEVEDAEAVLANASQLAATKELRNLEKLLDARLVEIERGAAAIFPANSSQQDRYRMKRIRNYLAIQRSKNLAGDVVDSESDEAESLLLNPTPKVGDKVATA